MNRFLLAVFFLSLPVLYSLAIVEPKAPNRVFVTPRTAHVSASKLARDSDFLYGVVRKDSTLSVPIVVVHSQTSTSENFFEPLRFAPARNKNGIVIGLWVTNVAKHSLFDALDLRNGDVITSVNNVPIRSMSDLLEAYKSIQKSQLKRLPVTLIRFDRSLDFVVTRR